MVEKVVLDISRSFKVRTVNNSRWITRGDNGVEPL